MPASVEDRKFMSRALELALRGRGHVEPNPMVGCVVVRGREIVGEGWHRQFGRPHAEIEALSAAGEKARGGEVFVTLEPCCHQGKTGPCTQALIEAGVGRVVVGCQDPNPQVAGRGLDELRKANIAVAVPCQLEQAQELIAPFAKLVTRGRPWVIAKWAMTLDGKLASHSGSSQWISGDESRARVHQLRGQVDAILVGRGTAQVDDPLLTARPSGPRVATRIVLDSAASLSSESQLVQSVDQAPLLVVTSEQAHPNERDRLEKCGAEVISIDGANAAVRLSKLLDELGRRQMTNLLVEGGATVLGTLLEVQEIDEVHVFIAPKLIGGGGASTVIGGRGIAEMADALPLRNPKFELLGEDFYVAGRIKDKH